MELRISKLVLLACVALYVSLVALNNLTDYGSNFEFVAHVLAMDSTFPENRLLWRAIESPALHHVAYVSIIITELSIAILSWAAVVKLYLGRADLVEFARGKRLATLALTLGIVLWFGGFIAIGGEWFAMWQSDTWNGIQSAFRITIFLTAVLIFVNLEEKDA